MYLFCTFQKITLRLHEHTWMGLCAQTHIQYTYMHTESPSRTHMHTHADPYTHTHAYTLTETHTTNQSTNPQKTVLDTFK